MNSAEMSYQPQPEKSAGKSRCASPILSLQRVFSIQQTKNRRRYNFYHPRRIVAWILSMIVVVTYENLDKQGGMVGRLSTKLAVYERKGLPNHSYNVL